MKYFEIWYEDKTSMLETMHKNMNADIEAGYNPRGKSIMKQVENIRSYAENFNREMEHLKELVDTRKIENWCRLDMLKRGVIEL